MASTTRTITEYTCDRCGATQADPWSSQGRSEWGGLSLAFRGSTGSRSWDGAGAEVKHEGKGWLCLKCTADFLKFIDDKR